MGYAAPTKLSIDPQAGVLNFNASSGFNRQVPLQNWSNLVSGLEQRQESGFGQTTGIYDEFLNDPTGAYFNQPIFNPQGQKIRMTREEMQAANADLQNQLNTNIDPMNLSSIPERWGGASGLASGLAQQEGFFDEYNAAQEDFINSQSGGTFGKFLKGAAPLAALAGGAFLAPALLGAGAAGVAGAGAATAGTAGATASSLGSLFSGFVAPQALSGAITGGLGALASGGDFGDALKGAALGGVGGGFGSSIGAGLGLGSLGQQAITGGLTGAAGGLATGDMKAALIGAGLGAGGGYIKGGGEVPFLGSAKQQLPAGVYGAPKQGTGILGGLTNATNTGLTIGGQPMKLGSLLSTGGDLYGMYQGQKDIDEIQDIYEQQAARAQAQFDPYAQAGQQALANMQAPSMEALQNDPGYQFRLGQGQQAVERSLAARGLGQSGAALKAAQEYGQGLADQTYQDFFSRQSQIANQGFNAAQGLGSIYSGLGNAQAGATLAGINNRNQGLSNLFGGFGGGDEYLDGSLSRLLGGLF